MAVPIGTFHTANGGAVSVTSGHRPHVTLGSGANPKFSGQPMVGTHPVGSGLTGAWRSLTGGASSGGFGGLSTFDWVLIGLAALAVVLVVRR